MPTVHARWRYLGTEDTEAESDCLRLRRVIRLALGGTWGVMLAIGQFQVVLIRPRVEIKPNRSIPRLVFQADRPGPSFDS